MMIRLWILGLVALFSGCEGGGGTLVPALELVSRDAGVGIEACAVPGCGGPLSAVESVPRAVCGPGAKEETGLQGQVSIGDRSSGRSLEEYSCNLELVSQARQGEGASWQFAWYDDCAYYGTLANEFRETAQGTVVVDASVPTRPFVSTTLQTPAMMDPHEALKVHEARGLLAAVELAGGADTGPQGSEDYFDVYDVTGDCAQPVLLASVALPGTTGHEGEWAQDGLTYYGSGFNTTGPSLLNLGNLVYAVDVADPANPAHVGSIPYVTHGLSTNAEGTRAYLAGIGPNGLAIFDTTEIQNRQADPMVSFVGGVFWTDGAAAQHTIPVTIQGNPYIIFVDEGGYGAARIIDISNEAAPFIVSKLKLEVHLPQNLPITLADGANGLIQYDAHYCSVDQLIEPTILACGYAWSGIRVFDIRDPLNPAEIAYYMPGAVNEVLLGSSHSQTAAQLVDRCPAQVRIRKDRGELWTQCQDNEFLVLRFTNGVWPFED